MVPEGVRVKLPGRLAALQRIPTSLHERAFSITAFSWPVVPPGRHGKLLRGRGASCGERPDVFPPRRSLGTRDPAHHSAVSLSVVRDDL